MKMVLKKFLSNVTKADTWRSLWSSLLDTFTGRKAALLPVPVMQERVEYGTLPMPDGSYLRYAHYYMTHTTPRSKMLVLSGRREFIEEYEDVNRDFLRRGFDVWCFDWRGQGASKRELVDPAKGHIEDYKTYIKDLEHFVNSFIRPHNTEPFYIFAHSMGAHILLRYVLENRPKDIKGAIVSAPMIDIRTGSYPYRVARGIARAMVLSGAREKYIFGDEPSEKEENTFEGNPYTKDPTRYETRISLQKKYPDYVVTGYTFSWLEATFRSIKKLRETMKEVTHDLPLLILSPQDDPVVKSESFAKILDCFQKAKMKVYADTGHCLMDERPEIRDQIWEDIDLFLNHSD